MLKEVLFCEFGTFCTSTTTFVYKNENLQLLDAPQIATKVI